MKEVEERNKMYIWYFCMDENKRPKKSMKGKMKAMGQCSKRSIHFSSN